MWAALPCDKIRHMSNESGQHRVGYVSSFTTEMTFRYFVHMAIICSGICHPRSTPGDILKHADKLHLQHQQTHCIQYWNTHTTHLTRSNHETYQNASTTTLCNQSSFESATPYLITSRHITPVSLDLRQLARPPILHALSQLSDICVALAPQPLDRSHRPVCREADADEGCVWVETRQQGLNPGGG